MANRPFFDAEHPLRLAHRGSRLLWPENTLTAFRGAADLGYRYIETDVRMTKDNVVVVFHDAELDRVTNASGPISDWVWADVRELDAGFHHGPDDGYPFRGTGVRVPSLAETFAAFPDVRFNIDLKAPGIESAVADVVRRFGRHDSVLVGSFFDGRIARFRRLTQGSVATSAGPVAASRMWAASRVGRPPRRVADAYQVPATAAGMRPDRRFVTTCHAAGAQVHVWTINDPGEMHRLLDIGADGIVSDRPDLLNAVIAERSAAG